MPAPDFLYQLNSLSIAALLFAAIVLCHEVSYRIGMVVQARSDKEIKTLTGSVQASILGLLALLLGFSFTMSMQRFDNRSMALIDEANAIASAQLHAQLLPLAQRQTVQQQLNDYIGLRVSISGFNATEQNERKRLLTATHSLQKQLWEQAVAASRIDPNPATTGAFIAALSSMIDSQGKRSALLQAHVPEPILLLLLLAFVSSGSIMGYSAGLSRRRNFAPFLLVSLLITLIVFIIVDLDRPKRGVITIDQTALTVLSQASVSTSD
jgi:hypothetical protein